MGRVDKPGGAAVLRHRTTNWQVDRPTLSQESMQPCSPGGAAAPQRLAALEPFTRTVSDALQGRTPFYTT